MVEIMVVLTRLSHNEVQGFMLAD